MWIAFLLLSVALLVLLNGFFVVAEFGLVKLRPTRVKSIAKKHGLQGRILQKVHNDLDVYLSACQLGITLASLGLGWIGEPTVASLLEPAWGWVGIESPVVIHSVSFFLGFFIISYLHIVIGELAPKSLAIRYPEAVGLWVALPLYLFYWSMYPAIWILNHSAFSILKLMGLDSSNHDADSQFSTEELKLILRSSRHSTKLNKQERNIVAHSLNFSGLELSDLMHPFNEAVALFKQNTLEENMQIIEKQQFSRYPYVDRENEEVLGLLYLKDIFLLGLHQELGSKDLVTLLRPVECFPPNLPAIELFRRFRQGAPHFAIVGYPGQKPAGFLTLDNLLSAFVGHINDEFNQEKYTWLVQEDQSLIGRGSLSIFSLEQMLGIDIPEQEAESVGGMIMYQLEDLPQEGQKIEFEQFSVVVKKMEGPRIVKVQVFPKIKGLSH